MIGRYTHGRLTAEDGRHDLRALPYGELRRAHEIITPSRKPARGRFSRLPATRRIRFIYDFEFCIKYNNNLL